MGKAAPRGERQAAARELQPPARTEPGAAPPRPPRLPFATALVTTAGQRCLSYYLARGRDTTNFPPPPPSLAKLPPTAPSRPHPAPGRRRPTGGRRPFGGAAGAAGAAGRTGATWPARRGLTPTGCPRAQLQLITEGRAPPPRGPAPPVSEVGWGTLPDGGSGLACLPMRIAAAQTRRRREGGGGLEWPQTHREELQESG